MLKREEKEKATRAYQDCAIFSGLAVEMPQALIRLPPLLPSHFLIFSLQWIDSFLHIDEGEVNPLGPELTTAKIFMYIIVK